MWIQLQTYIKHFSFFHTELQKGIPGSTIMNNNGTKQV
jgi:hypothetical protein